MSFFLIGKLVLRDWRAGELRLLLVSLVVAVGIVAGITMTVGRLQQAMMLEAASYLAADRVIEGGKPIPQRFVEEAGNRGLEMANTLGFSSMVVPKADESRTQFVSVKAVDGNYPLRGTLKVAEEPFTIGSATPNVPRMGTVWLDSRLFPALGVELGDTVSVGYADLVIEEVLTYEPDRGGSMWDMGPRLLMNLGDVEQTQVVQPGSRLQYKFLVAGDRVDLDALFESIRGDLRPDFRWTDVRRSVAQIGRALDRAERFFLIGGSLAVLLAGVAIALSAQRYAARHINHVGILKTLGATPNDVMWGVLGVLGLIGCAGIVLGYLAGSAVHFYLVWHFQHLLPPELPDIGYRSLILSSVTGLICLFTFALPQFWALRNISPLRVLRRDIADRAHSRLITYGFAAVGSVGLLIWYAEDVELVVGLMVGIAITCAVFSVVAMLLLKGGRVVGTQAGSVWRLALAGLQRRSGSNTGQIIVFGLAIMMLLIIFLLRTTLLEEWQAQLPDDLPNHFVINVTKDQVEGVESFLDSHAGGQGFLLPMLPGRIIAVNGEDVQKYQEEPGRRRGGGPRLSSSRQLTYLNDLPNENRVIEGRWWDPNTTEHEVSIEKDYASTWGLELGDVLTFLVSGTEVEAKVTSVRTLVWESFQPNFFMILSPSALQELPATFITGFHLEDEAKRHVQELISDFPTITVIDVGAIIEQVQTILSRATQAVEWVLYLVLAGGVLVLIAAIQSGRDHRMREYALIRSLGGSKNLITGSLVAEFAFLGGMAGLVAVCGAELSMGFIEQVIFEFDYNPRPMLWFLGPLMGISIILSVGYLGTRKLVSTAPIVILRDF